MELGAGVGGSRDAHVTSTHFGRDERNHSDMELLVVDQRERWH